MAGGLPVQLTSLVLVAGTALYLGVVVWLLTGIGRSRRASGTALPPPPVSVIVAARDEGERIGACVRSLAGQSYEGALQIVVVDDRSGDDTGPVLAALRSEWQAAAELVLVRAPDPPRFACPKKSALAAGIDRAAGEILLFTDADCQPPPDWVRALVSRFEGGVGLVAGYAYPHPPAASGSGCWRSTTSGWPLWRREASAWRLRWPARGGAWRTAGRCTRRSADSRP